jgi:hypothetical protein
MSTSDSLSDSLDNLSLAANTPPSSSTTTRLNLDSTILLVSSDHESFSVDVPLLYSASSVFKDMLQTGSGALVCEMTESAKEVVSFLGALKSGTVPVNEEEWLSLLHFKEKYNVPSLNGVLFGGIWSVLPVLCFILPLPSVNLRLVSASSRSPSTAMRQPACSAIKPLLRRLRKQV